MRSLVCVLVLSVGCGSPPAPKRPTGSGSAVGGGAVTPGGAKPTPTGSVAVRDVGCLQPSCVFHAGAGGYFTCQSGGAGTCFHFGAPCTPAGACMYDPAARTYKQCTQPVEGQCAAWGAACAPASKCMFDVKDGLHRTCEAVSGGSCAKFGALCKP